MSENFKNRLKNYGLWVSVASFVLLLLQIFGVHVIESQYNNVVNSFLGILVMLGIISNPVDGKGYLDTTKSK